MSERTEEDGVVTSILRRKPARPFNESSIERAMQRADELKGQAEAAKPKGGLQILVRGDEGTPARLVRTDEETPDDDLDLHVDELEGRIEVLEGKLNATLIVVGCLATVIALGALFF